MVTSVGLDSRDRVISQRHNYLFATQRLFTVLAAIALLLPARALPGSTCLCSHHPQQTVGQVADDVDESETAATSTPHACCGGTLVPIASLPTPTSSDSSTPADERPCSCPPGCEGPCAISKTPVPLDRGLEHTDLALHGEQRLRPHSLFTPLSRVACDIFHPPRA